jgi:hypothetical protein
MRHDLAVASLPFRAACSCAVLAVVLLAGADRAGAQTLEEQVALSVELLELSVEEWRERNAVAAAEGADEASRAAALLAVEKTFRTARARLYERYVTTAADHLTFFARHAAEVDEYLADNPEIADRIDSLSRTLRTLIGGEESKGETATGARP